jgi:hypothetical protein
MDDKNWFIFWGFTLVIIGVVILGCVQLYNQRTTKYVDNGYCQAMLVGSSECKWQKCK